MTLRIEDQNRRCPDRVKTMKVFRIFLDVNFQWNKVLVDERRECGVIVRLGFQPSACSSRRCRAEVDKERFVLLFRESHRGLGVFDPINEHDHFLQI